METLNPTAASAMETLNPTTAVTTDSPSVDHTLTGSIASSEQPTPNDAVESGAKRKRDDADNDPDLKAETNPENSTHPLYKTSLCSYYRRPSGSCSHGDTCRFAHSEEELRARPDGSWDPTSERAKKMARREKEEEEEEEEEGGGGEVEKSVLMSEAMVECGGDVGLSKCLVHLPRKWSSDQLKNYLTEQGVVFKSVKKKKGMTVGFVSFETSEQATTATEALEGKSLGNKKVKVADVIPRSYDHKIKSAQSKQQIVKPGSGDNMEPSTNDTDNDVVVNDSVSKARSVRDAVTPLAHLPYAEQLEQKRNSLTQTLKRLTRNARKACPNGVPLPDWILKSREIGALPCKLEGVMESPLVNGYRNKCEFSVGYSVHGKPTVGFMLGNFREGVTAVEEPANCPNVSRIACKYASILQEFLQHSDLPIWNRFSNTGFWRQLTVREGRSPVKAVEVDNPEACISEVMLMIQVCTVGFDDDKMSSELQKLCDMFVTGASSSSPPLPLTALVLQDHRGISNAAPADAPLRPLAIPKSQNDSGAQAANADCETRIHDYIGSLKFSISPTAFFQVNTLAAEKLYSLAGEWAGLGQGILLFDVCCGTGTIGLTLANRVGLVVGIEMNASAVSDAQRNAEINGIKNCRFVCSKAEDVMGSLLKDYLNTPQQRDESLNSVEDETEQKDTSNTRSMSPSNESESEKVIPGESTRENGQEVGNHLHSKTGEEDGHAKKRHFDNVVAVVDPPRSGLHPVVIKALRTHPRLRRLVYISCNPETLVANAIELCTPSSEKTKKGNKKNHGWRNMGNTGLARHRAKSMPMSEPFRPVKAMAVDLFPHTTHCEMVMLLER